MRARSKGRGGKASVAASEGYLAIVGLARSRGLRVRTPLPAGLVRTVTAARHPTQAQHV